MVLDYFVKLGLPTAIIAIVLLAILFKRTYRRVATCAAYMAIVAIGIYGAIQLAQVLTGSDVTVSFEPPHAQAFTRTGRPVDLKITVRRNGKAIRTETVKKLTERAYESRPLVLGLPRDKALSVMYQESQIGLLSKERLRDAGWRPAEECTSASNESNNFSRFWQTNRVYAGRVCSLGSSPYGTLKIRADSFGSDGKAIVTLILGGHGQPIPSNVAIPNKGLNIQSFSDVPEFYIAVREADFTDENPWAAFIVFSR